MSRGQKTRNADTLLSLLLQTLYCRKHGKAMCLGNLEVKCYVLASRTVGFLVLLQLNVIVFTINLIVYKYKRQRACSLIGDYRT